MLLLIAQVGPLSISYPAMAVAAVATTLIPILIHLLTRLRRRPQAWAAMQFLLQAQRRHRRRLKLEQWLLLALRCLIPLLVGLALSGPILSGCASSTAGWLGGSLREQERLICLVIDDGISTQTDDGTGGMRFDQLRQQALDTIRDLGSTDQVAVWRSAFPAKPLAVEGVPTLSAVREAIESMKPRYSRSDLVNALSMVQNSLAQNRHTAENIFVVLLSDFARQTLPRQGTLLGQLAPLDSHSRILVARPKPEASNVQITQLQAQQQVIFAAPGHPSPSLPVEIHLRRFVDDASQSTTILKLALFGEDSSKPLAETELNHRWTGGQDTAVLHANMTLSPIDRERNLSAPTQASATQVLTLSAKIDHLKAVDALKADNQHWSVLKLKQRVRIGMIAQQSAEPSTIGSPSRLTTSGWIRMALQPNQRVRSPSFTIDNDLGIGESILEVRSLSATLVKPQSIQMLDAALVMRPDLISQETWVELRRLVDRGGMVWLYPSPHEPIGSWTNAISDHLGLKWHLGDESSTSDLDREDGMALVVDEPTPEPLKLLASDWRVLLAPVRIRRRFECIVQQPEASSDIAWLKTVDGKPLLLSSEVGRGHVLLWATSLEPEWSNIVTKPLFVPMLHETIRGVLSKSGSTNQGIGAIFSGQKPNLGPLWERVKTLVKTGTDIEKETKISLTPSSDGVQPETELELPGVYQASPSIGEALPVNPDTKGGDTRMIDINQLKKGLTALGQWSWLEASEPAHQLMLEEKRIGLSRSFLWIALALAVLEMFTARWFSYASIAQDGGKRWLR